MSKHKKNVQKIKEMYKDYTIHNELASGGTSHVYRVTDNETGETRVMKVTSFSRVPKQLWLNELNMLQKFQYVRGIVKMYEFGEGFDANNDSFGYCVLEMCDSDVFESPVPKQELLKFLSFVANILVTIHSLGYCYCDLKSENILRKMNGYRLCDFSSCQPIGTHSTIIFGTLSVMAPEIRTATALKCEYVYDEKIDSWGFGCLLFELLTQTTPDLTNNSNLLKSIQRITVDPTMDAGYRKIIELCLDNDPKRRATMQTVMRLIHDLVGDDVNKC